MGYKIEGNDTIGYRVVDEERGALTGRKATEADALAVAGIDTEPKRRGGRKPAEQPDES